LFQEAREDVLLLGGRRASFRKKKDARFPKEAKHVIPTHPEGRTSFGKRVLLKKRGGTRASSLPSGRACFASFGKRVTYVFQQYERFPKEAKHALPWPPPPEVKLLPFLREARAFKKARGDAGFFPSFGKGVLRFLRKAGNVRLSAGRAFPEGSKGREGPKGFRRKPPFY